MLVSGRMFQLLKPGTSDPEDPPSAPLLDGVMAQFPTWLVHFSLFVEAEKFSMFPPEKEAG